MKHKSNIDQRFKEGLDQQGMQYKEEYWDSMSALLDEQGISAKALYREIYLIAIIALLQVALYIIPRSAERDLSLIGDQLRPTEIEEIETKNNQDDLALASINQEANSAYDNINSSEEVEIKTGLDPKNRTDFANALSNVSPSARNLVRSEPEVIAANDLKVIEEEAETFTANQEPKLSEEAFEMPISLGFMSFHSLESIPVEKLESKAKKVNFDPRFRPSIDLYVEPYAQYQVYNRNLGENAPINLKQDEVELNSSGFGIKLRLQRGNWNLSSGFGTHSIRERVTYTESFTSYSYDSSLRVVDWNYGSTGSGNKMVLLAWDVDSVGTTHQRNKCENCETEFKYFNVPVDISYGMMLGRSEIFFSGGLNFHFLQSAKGIYSGSSAAEELSANPQVARTSWMSWTAGMSYRTNIYGPVGIMASYQYQQGVNSMISLYDQRARLHNLQVGLSVKLF